LHERRSDSLSVLVRDLVRELVAICGDANVFWKPEDTMVFEYDAGFDRRPPGGGVGPARPGGV
jgi:hypothetical protein